MESVGISKGFAAELIQALTDLPAPCDEPRHGGDAAAAPGRSPAGAVGEAEAPASRDLKALQAENERLKAQRDVVLAEKNTLTTALAESERKRVEAEAEIAAAHARLPESLRDSRLEFGVANLAMGYRSANDGRWRYGYAMRMLLQFVDRAAGEGLAFIETEDGPAIDAADLCADVADLLRIELDSDTFRALAKPPSEAELSALISQEAENGR